MVFLYWNISLVVSFCCFFMTAGEETGMMPSPVNATVQWSSDFCPKITWTKPQLLDKCSVNYTIQKQNDKGQEVDSSRRTPNTSYNHTCMSREHNITFIITTIPINCSQRTSSRPARVPVPRLPEVVKDFSCVYYSQNKANCTWLPLDSITNLQSFFWFENLKSPVPCEHGILKGSQLIGCHLEWNQKEKYRHVYFLINASHTHTSTFKRDLWKFVRLDPPEVVLAREDNRLLISWSAPDFRPSCFEYDISVTECGKESQLVTYRGEDGTTHSLQVAPHCSYSVRVRSRMVSGLEGGSPFSTAKVFRPDSPGDLVLISVVISASILLIFCILLFFFHKYKEKLLPNIPEPRLKGESLKLLMLLHVPEVIQVAEVCPDDGNASQQTTAPWLTHSQPANQQRLSLKTEP